MTDGVVVIVAGVIAFLLFRMYARRRLAGRDGRFIWLYFAPTLLGGAVMLWTGMQMVPRLPIPGALLLAFAVVYVSLLLRALASTARGISATPPTDDLGETALEPLADFALTTTMMLLLGAVVALIALLVWLALR